MTLHSPFLISPRLLPALKIGDTTLSIEPTRNYDKYGKPVWNYYLDGEVTHQGSDLNSNGGVQETMACLLSFLAATGEAYHYYGNKTKKGSTTDLFPEDVCQWAYVNSEELMMLEMELQETLNLVEGA